VVNVKNVYTQGFFYIFVSTTVFSNSLYLPDLFFHYILNLDCRQFFTVVVGNFLLLSLLPTLSLTPAVSLSPASVTPGGHKEMSSILADQ
jgi:hypothetical protein